MEFEVLDEFKVPRITPSRIKPPLKSPGTQPAPPIRKLPTTPTPKPNTPTTPTPKPDTPTTPTPEPNTPAPPAKPPVSPKAPPIVKTPPQINQTPGPTRTPGPTTTPGKGPGKGPGGGGKSGPSTFLPPIGLGCPKWAEKLGLCGFKLKEPGNVGNIVKV